MSVFLFFIPWEPSVFMMGALILSGYLYYQGSRRLPISRKRRFFFWLSWILFYGMLQTRMDYYAEHEFFIHRLQHLVLHHLAPLIMMTTYPIPVIWAALPKTWRRTWHRYQRNPILSRCLDLFYNPAWVSFLFVASVLIWLIPSVQFLSMIDWRLYRLMNLSVVWTGLIYWHMVLDRRPAPPARLKPGLRILSPVITMSPQILVGALITFTTYDLYPIFDLCGRALGVPALLDQSIGGLIMWVPASLLEGVGGLIALRHWMRLSQRPIHHPMGLQKNASVFKTYTDSKPL